MNWRIWAPILTVLAAVLLVLLEGRYPYDRGQKLFREGFWTDLLLYALLQSYVLALVIGGAILWLDGRTGWSRLGHLARWPVAAQVLFFVVTHDLYIYWFHRWQHSSPRLWRLHEAHHSARTIDWLAGARSHAFEILINQTIEFAPMLLLGAAPEVPLIKGMISGVWGMYIHSNLDVHTGRLQRLINGPEAHRWHHSTDLAPPGMNFSTKLAIWDVLFGTLWLPAGEKPEGYGLTYVSFPRGYLRQHLFAFRPLALTAGLPHSALHCSIMSDERKYRHRGYQDSGRSSEPRSSGPQPPREQKEGPRGRGLGAPTDTVFRCAKCGEKRPIAEPIELDTVCKKCGADLHTCSNCIHFDTSARWECRKFEQIPARILKKSTHNECAFFEPKTVQEFNREGGKPSPGGARAAFDALFKI